MDAVALPVHHSPRLCALVHFTGPDGLAYDYCTDCRAFDWCIPFTAPGAPTMSGTGPCGHPLTDRSEPDTRETATPVPAGHERLHRRACRWEHYRDLDQDLNGALDHDTAVVFHRCTGCGSTMECGRLRGPEHECSLMLTYSESETT
jgi:hypothetical protein